MKILHNPNCLLSPTHRHIYDCMGDTCTCKICGTKQEHCITYIDNTVVADRLQRNLSMSDELLELSEIR